VLQYGAMLHLGALNGMNREVPAALGRGDPADAEALRRSTIGFMLLSYAVALAVVLGVLVPLGLLRPTATVGLTAALLAAQQGFAFAMMHLKARTDFGGAARLQVASALLFAPATVLGAWLAGLEGFLAGQVVVYALLCSIAALGTKRLYAPRFDGAGARRLIRIGFPIMLVGLAHALFATVDRWVIQGALGPVALGHYALAIMALGAVGLLPQVVAQQVYPRMSMAWARERSWSALEPLIARQRWTSLAIVLPIIGVLAVAAPWGIRTFLPAYAPAIPALLVSLAIPLVSVVGQGFGNAFNVVGLQRWYLAAIALATAVNMAVSLALVGELGLVGVALGTLAGFTALAAALLAAGRRARQGRLGGGTEARPAVPPQV
jgi:O-antigen/teichoic acid export membrane protein